MGKKINKQKTFVRLWKVRLELIYFLKILFVILKSGEKFRQGHMEKWFIKKERPHNKCQRINCRAFKNTST